MYVCYPSPKWHCIENGVCLCFFLLPLSLSLLFFSSNKRYFYYPILALFISKFELILCSLTLIKLSSAMTTMTKTTTKPLSVPSLALLMFLNVINTTRISTRIYALQYTCVTVLCIIFELNVVCNVASINKHRNAEI